MSIQENKVIVLAAGPNGLGVIRSLHLKGISVTAITLSKKDISHYSRIPTAKYTVQGEDNSAKHQWLLTLLQQQPENTTIIPTSDWFVSFLAEHTQVLKKTACLYFLNKRSRIY